MLTEISGMYMSRDPGQDTATSVWSLIVPRMIISSMRVGHLQPAEPVGPVVIRLMAAHANLGNDPRPGVLQFRARYPGDQIAGGEQRNPVTDKQWREGWIAAMTTAHGRGA
ncbi:MAG: hypothetical protein R3A10_12105 [Caldilineaceae bacterium]